MRLLLAAALLVAVSTLADRAAAPASAWPPASIDVSPVVRLDAGVGVFADPGGAPVAPEAAPRLHAGLDEPFEFARLGPASLPPPGEHPEQSFAGVAVLVGADIWHEAGFSGHGVRVAVIDVGFSGYEEAFAEAAALVRARSFRADGSLDGGSGHGLRAASIVHELAPRAELLLLSFSGTETLAAAVEYAIEEGVDIISFSIGFVHNGPGDGTGPVNEIVDRAVEAGVLWAAAAGNWARQHWAGPFSDPDGDGVHEFSPGEPLNGRHYAAGDLISASLRWDDQWGAACSDYDLELVGPEGTLVQASRGVQDCDDNPVEGLRVLATTSGRYAARVVAAPGTSESSNGEHALSLLLLGTPGRDERLDWFEPAGSISQPADHPSVVAVGILSSAGEVARFSSRGPAADGRLKPDLLAPTVLPDADATGPTLGGTSDAAPIVAAVGALLIEAMPELSGEEVAAALRERARQRGATPPDLERGPAIVQLGALDGLGPLLPPGGREATLSGERDPEGGYTAFSFSGPDGYPLRFLHLLLDDPQPLAIWRYNANEERWMLHVAGAPDWVNDLESFDGGDELWMRFPVAEVPVTEDN